MSTARPTTGTGPSDVNSRSEEAGAPGIPGVPSEEPGVPGVVRTGAGPDRIPDLLYTEDEGALRSAVRRVLADHCDPAAVLAHTESDTPYDPRLWQALTKTMGLAGLLVPEDLGGQGATHRETAVILEELGRALAPVPFLTSAVMATEALLGCDVEKGAEAALGGAEAGLGGAEVRLGGAEAGLGGAEVRLGGAEAAPGADTGRHPAAHAAESSARTPGAYPAPHAGRTAQTAPGGEADRPPDSGAAGRQAESGGRAAGELLTELATGHTIAVLAVPFSTGPVVLPDAPVVGPVVPSARSEPAGRAAMSTAPSSGRTVPRAPQLGMRHERGTLHGTISGVADAVAADVLLVPTDTGLYAVDVHQEGVTVTPQTSLDRTRPLAEVTCTAAQARLLTTDVAGALRRAMWAGAGLLSCEQLGIADWCLTETVRYTRERHQFNRPVASFQALKHRLAQLWLETAHARAAARNAADALAANSPETALAVTLAQSYTSGVAVHAAEEALQLHGGIGMTWEHPLHLYLKRAKADSIVLGTAGHHREQLGHLADLRAPGEISASAPGEPLG